MTRGADEARVCTISRTLRSMTSASPNLAEILIRRTDVADVVETGGEE